MLAMLWSSIAMTAIREEGARPDARTPQSYARRSRLWTRSLPDAMNNTAATMSFPADRNKAPGDYAGTLVTFELAAARRF